MARYQRERVTHPEAKIRARTKKTLGNSTKNLIKLKKWYMQVPIGARIGDRKQQLKLKKRYEATGKKIEKINRDVKKLMSSQEVKRLAQGGW